MELLKERIIKLELWVVRFKMPRRILDFQLHNNQRSVLSLMIIEVNSRHQTNNLTHTNPRSKNFSQKTIILDNR